MASKTRNYTTIVYPESAPGDWLETLEGWHVKAVVSPLHDRDVKKDGSPKKPHFHVLFMWPGPKTFDNARKYCLAIGGVGCEAVEDVGDLARYLCHEGHPEKAQYSRDDVKVFGGVDYAALCARGDKDEVYKMLAEIMDFCEDNRMTSFARLLGYARKDRPEWFKILCGPRHAVVYRFLRSLEYEYEKEGPKE